jgi:HPt (histidine-containing phosphotransfer) domain-containing protein
VDSKLAEGMPPEIARRFALLQDNFRKGLGDRLASLERADLSPEALAPLLHQLCGAAGGYGFSALGELAREAENLCRDGDPQQRLPGVMKSLVTELQHLRL